MPVDNQAPPRPGSLTRFDWGGVLLRSYFFQTLWNYQRMQSLGWLFGFTPVLRRLYPDPKDRSRVSLEHLEYFNTHPCQVNILLGVMAGLEERRAAGDGITREQIFSYRRQMSGPLAALGETLCSATARPLFAVGSLALGFLFDERAWWVVPALFLLACNATLLAIRVWGQAIGYRLTIDVGRYLMRFDFQRLALNSAVVGLGVSAGVLVALLSTFGMGRWVAGVFVAGALAARRAGVSATGLLYLSAALCVVFHYGAF